ncbi:PAS domain S-box protein [Chloroflexota bacterium]
MVEINRKENHLIQELSKLRLLVTELRGSKSLLQHEIDVLRESAEKYQELLKNTNDAMFASILSDEEGASRFLEVNDAACARLGYTREEFLNLSYHNIVAPERHSDLLRLRQRIIKEKYVAPYELVHVTKDGKSIPVELSSRMFNLKGCNIVLTLARDITERKQAEAALKKSHRELRNLSRHLQSIREEERTAIAREIHDELGQTLTALKLDLYWVNKRLPKEMELLRVKIGEMLKTVGTTLETASRITAELRPAILDDLGLVTAIRWWAEEFEKRTNIRCQSIIRVADNNLGKELSTAIFRIFQEALTNVARHANATNVNICLKEDKGDLVLKIADNGKGIEKKVVTSSRSFGLIGMRERTIACGGIITIKGTLGKGTFITLRVPSKEIG